MLRLGYCKNPRKKQFLVIGRQFFVECFLQTAAFCSEFEVEQSSQQVATRLAILFPLSLG